jgi:hypothetical protein
MGPWITYRFEYGMQEVSLQAGSASGPRPAQDRNLPCDGQPLTTKSATNGADTWVGRDEDER